MGGLLGVSWWSRSRRRLALVVVPVVALSLVSASPVAAVSSGAVGEPPVVDVPVSVPVSGVPERERVVAESESSAPWAPGPVVWPEAGVSTVDVTGGAVRAGGFPVWVSGVGSAGSVSSVRVEVLGRDVVSRWGVRGVGLRLGRADGGSAAGRVRVEVDYSGFRHGFGAGFGSRLGVVRLPGCVLSTPELPVCQVATPVGGVVNNAVAGRLSAVVEAAAGAVLPAGAVGRLAAEDAVVGGSVLVVTPLSVSSGADFSKTSLSPAYSWRAGVPGGDFSWALPLPAPPGAGGPTPSVGLGYSSGGVDGRTNAEGAQASLVGEGWGLTGAGFIERRFRRCADDQSPTPAYTDASGDLCWRLPNATLAWGGRSTELVVDDATGRWRLADDDGSRVELLTGAGNGDDDGEHWRVTTTDGTQYFFGLNRLPGWSVGVRTTGAAWTVPVFANHTGDPCYAAGGFGGSFCAQAWRWNLDYVVDRHGNSMSYWYSAAQNKTALAGVFGNTAFYQRDGELVRVEYGTRAGTEATDTTPPARMQLGYDERCLAACWVVPGQDPEEANWPDTPWDFNCPQSPCGNNLTPTFWSNRRLASVTTQVRQGAAWRDVRRWVLTHQFPATGESGHDPSLWLARVDQAGLVGGSVVLPPVLFGGARFANRTDFNTVVGIPKTFKYRVTTVDNGTGGQLLVDYEHSDCTQSVQADPDQNQMRCFRQWYAPPGGGAASWSWWNKYRVTSVTERDLTGGSPDLPHTYGYSTGGSSSAVLWHHNDDAYSASVGLRDWSIWRGYSTVTVTDGPAGGVRSQSTYLYMRGMHGDRTDTGPGTRVVTVTGSDGVAVDDDDHLAGFLREVTVHDGPGGQVLSGRINDPWAQQTARRQLPPGWGTPLVSLAHFTRTAKTRSRTWLAHNSTWLRTETETTFEATYAQPTLVKDTGDPTTTSDDVCTATSYARNTTAWLIDFPAESVTTTCAASPTGADFLGGTQTFYDGSTVLGAAPGRGLPTRTNTLASVTGTTLTWDQTGRATFDSHGRVLDVFDALDHKTSTAYTPATGGPVTGIATTNPLLHAVTTTLDPAWGAPTRVQDANGKLTDAAYDPLGRLATVWLPGRDRGLAGNAEFVYTVRDTAGSTAVTARQLGPNGNQIISYDLFDGMLRPRQTQSTAPDGKRVITDTGYDGRGLAVKASVFYHNAVPADVLAGFSDADIDRQTATVYDSTGRATHVLTLTGGVELWRTSTAYDGDRTASTPPAGGTATTTVVDARGRTTELRQYTTAGTPSGVFNATGYGYDRLGRLSSVTDPAGNDWTYSYDLRGRRTATTDPDAGTATVTFDDNGRPVTTTDARGEVIANVYDALGRVVERRDDSPAGALRASWVFDTVANGQLTSSTRHAGSDAYTTTVTGYTDLYQPTGTTITIPAAETGLSGGYTFGATYHADGSPATQSLPAAGGLAAETITTAYTTAGLVASQTGLSTYLQSVQYDWDGQIVQQTLGTGTSRVRLSTDYENITGRLLKTQVHTENPGTPDTWDEVHTEQYRFNDAGTLKSLTEQHNSLTTSAQCFTYDQLQRLTQAWTNAAFNCTTTPASVTDRGPDPYWTTWTFDTVGNRLTQVTHGTGGGSDVTTTYTHPSPGGAQPHALSSTTNPAGAYSYDPAGNTTGRTVAGSSQTLTWDPEGHLATHTINGQTSSYLYDPDGNRLIRRDPTGTTLYLPAGTELRHTPGGGTTCTRHYPNAVRTTTGLAWTAGDHHGTRQTAIDATTLTVTRRLTMPYGQPRGTPPGSWPGERGFVDGTADPSGLVHLGAREYDPTTGRFVSLDPVMNLTSPQQWHGYAYASNNPTTLSDPTGLDPGGGQRIDEERKKREGTPGGTVRPPGNIAAADKDINDQRDRAKALFLATYTDDSLYCRAHLAGSCSTVRQAVADGEMEPYLGMIHVLCGGVPGCIERFFASGGNVRAFLTILGFFPGVGEIADGAGAALDVAAGDWEGAALSTAAMVPFLGNGAGAKRLDNLVASQRFVVDSKGAIRDLQGPQAQILLNKAVGDGFRDDLAAYLRERGRTVTTDQQNRGLLTFQTPYGPRTFDLGVWDNKGNLLGYVEAKAGGSPYNAAQQAKDAWLHQEYGFNIAVVRQPG